MGWFALPAQLKEKMEVHAEPITSSRILTQEIPFQFGEHVRLDRQWEILSISVPALRIEGLIHTNFEAGLEHAFRSDFLAAWEPEIGVSLAINVMQSGLVIGSVSFNSVIKPIERNLELPFGFMTSVFNTGYFSLSNSLQNPITVRGEESVDMHAQLSITVPKLNPLTYEFEEGSGESKHNVRKEVAPTSETARVHIYFGNVEETGVSAQTAPGGVILYINESDKEETE